MLGYRAEADEQPGVWIGWLERHRGFLGSLMGRRGRGILAGAVLAVHAVLTDSPLISDVRWHHRQDFDRGHEEAAASSPIAA